MVMVMSQGVGVCPRWGSSCKPGQIHPDPGSCHHITVPFCSWWGGSTLEALRSGLEHPLACWNGCEERTHFPHLFLGWGDTQPFKGSLSIFSHRSLILFPPLVCLLCGLRILCNLRQNENLHEFKTHWKKPTVLFVGFIFVFLHREQGRLSDLEY